MTHLSKTSCPSARARTALDRRRNRADSGWRMRRCSDATAAARGASSPDDADALAASKKERAAAATCCCCCCCCSSSSGVIGSSMIAIAPSRHHWRLLHHDANTKTSQSFPPMLTNHNFLSHKQHSPSPNFTHTGTKEMISLSVSFSVQLFLSLVYFSFRVFYFSLQKTGMFRFDSSLVLQIRCRDHCLLESVQLC
jgi:hypothetical protein